MQEKPIQPNETPSNLQTQYLAFAAVLAKDFISIAELDLRTETAVILQSLNDRELEGKELPWRSLLARYAERRVYPDDRAMLHSLSSASLEDFLAGGEDDLVLEMRCTAEDAAYLWAEVKVSPISIPEKRLLITTRSVDGQRMLKNIVEQFVFSNYDYFILLNAKTNSYTMFSGDRNGAPIPPVSGDDYESEVARFNAKYIVPEEVSQVTANMQIAHVLKMLESEPSYSFTSSGVTEDGAPRRTRVQFRYYDKAAGLLLLTRTDITEMFLEEQAKNQLLTAALYDAQHDALTGLLNHKGTGSTIRSSLAQLQGAPAAFLFIDVDNFKMVNDTLGHQEGDRLLRFLGNAIQEITAQTGIAGRIGGDEFLLYLPQFSSTRQLMEYAQQVCRIFDSFTKGNPQDLPISCSVGISTYPKDGTDYDNLLRKADQALYTSKRYGKNKYYFYSEEIPPMQK